MNLSKISKKIIEHNGVIDDCINDNVFDNQDITEDDFFALFRDKVKKREFYKKVNPLKSDKGTIRKNLMISALIRKSNIVTQAANLIGIHPDTHYHWLKTDEEYAQKVASLDNYVLDFVEGKLLEQINAGDSANTRFYLSVKGKKRGYGQSETTAEKTATESNLIPNTFLKGVATSENVNYLFFQIQSFVFNPSLAILILRGGTRFGKTYEGMNFLLYNSYFDTEKHYLVTRNTRPALENGAVRDITDIIQRFSLDFTFTKPAGRFEYLNNKTKTKIVVQAYSEPSRAEGHAYHHIFMDEAPRIAFGVYQQLRMRCTGKFILAFNPVDAECWVNVKLEQERKAEKQDVQVMIGNHRQNKFLKDEVRNEIEYFDKKDPNYKRVHIDGEYGITEGMIYPDFDIVSDDYFFNTVQSNHIAFGCDWGFNPDPMAVCVIKYDSTVNALYVHELCYKNNEKDNSGFAFRVIQEFCEIQNVGINSHFTFCDHSPALIQDLNDKGLWADNAKKNIKDGINTIKKTDIFITSSSKNLLSEIRKYKNKERSDGVFLAEPEDKDNHLMDAMRYAFYSYYLYSGFRF